MKKSEKHIILALLFLIAAQGASSLGVAVLFGWVALCNFIICICCRIKEEP